MNVMSPSVKVDETNLWKEDEESTYTKGFSKAKEIQNKIDHEVSCLVYSPPFEEKFPELSSKIKALNYYGRVATDRSSFEWIRNEITRHLKKEGHIKLTTEFAKKIETTLEKTTDAIENFTRSSKDSTGFPGYHVIREFLVTFKQFIEKNKTQCQDAAIYEVLFEDKLSSKSKETDDFSIQIKALDDIVDDLDNKYLSQHNSELMCYRDFLSPVEKTVTISINSLMQPHQDKGTVGDNPLGIGLTYNIMEKQRHEWLVNITSEEKFTSESAKAVEKASSFSKRTIEAQSLKEQLSVALEIINNIDNKYDLRVPLPMRLHTLYVLSINSKECPRYFKTLALRLCNEIDQFEKKEPESPGEKPDCCIQ